MPNFVFFKGSGTSFFNTFCLFFPKKKNVLLSIYRTNFIVLLPSLLEILGNMSIVIICCPVCGAMYIEINLSFLIKSLFYISKKSK